MYNPYKINPEQLRTELKLLEKNRAKSAWFNPTTYPTKDPNTGRELRPRTIYVGESGNITPTWEDAALDLDKYIQSKEAVREGKISQDKAEYNPWIGSEWQNRVNEANQFSKIHTAGTVTTDDFSAINVINVMAELLGTTYRQYAIEGAITRVNTPSITL